MISKELLSEVLNENVTEVSIVENTVIAYCNGVEEINIYELAHKCKEWAISIGFWVSSGLSINVSRSVAEDINGKYNNIIEYFEAETEPEAIFKACEYIMENKNES